ncbi:MAG TPA: CARDB domain-containing protein [Candidatus Hydrogenedentes bacterium]|nr:CARDB domain-containing protein [Candidatus Hydrogenedentota bacterium]
MASDEASHVQYAKLFYKRESGGWTQYETIFTVGESSYGTISFDTTTTGGNGQYSFYTRATDFAGNEEDAPADADQTTFIVGSFAGTVVYADSGSAGEHLGTDWTNPLRSIQMSLDVASAFSVPAVWAREGTFNESISLPNDVHLFGGFAGGESGTGDRDLSSHHSIIDGQGVRRPVTMDTVSNAWIDGFFIIASNNNGIYVNASGDTNRIVNCRISGNTAENGAGLALLSSSVPIINSLIGGNWANNVGGAVYAGSSSSTFTNCIFSGNAALWQGGGIFQDGSSCTCINCVISDNYVSHGAEMYFSGGVHLNWSSPVFINTIFTANNPWQLNSETGSIPTLSHCVLQNTYQGDWYPGQLTGANQINLYLPGAVNTYDGDPLFVSGSTGTWTADATYDSGTLRSTLTDDAATFVSGALVGQFIKPSTAENPNWQGMIIANTDKTLQLIGNYTWASTGDTYQIMDYHIQDGSPALDRGDVGAAPLDDLDGDVRPGTDGNVDIGADEAGESFTPPADTQKPYSIAHSVDDLTLTSMLTIAFDAADAESGFKHVQLYYRREGGAWTLYTGTYATSPIAFDTATTGGNGFYEFYTIATDNVDNVEDAPVTPDESSIVIGSFAGTQVYVSVNATGEHVGTDADNGLRSIAQAIVVAQTFSVPEVWVVEGTYTSSFSMASGVAVYGGFAGTESNPSERDIAAHPSILDGQDAQQAVVFNDVSNTRLDGFTITNCWNGAIYMAGCDNTNMIENCIITGNHGDMGGGVSAGINSANSSPKIIGCTITVNQGGGVGPGIYISGGSPEVTNCTISGNWDAGAGGGIFLSGTTTTLTGCTVSGNSAAQCSGWCWGAGGGLYIESSTVTITDCVISGNFARANGGGIYAGGSALTITGSDFSSNSCSQYSSDVPAGGGIYLTSCGPVTIENSTFYGNGLGVQADNAAYGAGLYCNASSPAIAKCQFITNMISGEGSGLGAGILCTNGSSPTLTNCLMSGNGMAPSLKNSWGGAMYADATCGPILMNCTLVRNSANMGGGFFSDNAFPAFTNVVFYRNENYGLYEANASSGHNPMARYCVFNSNTAGDYYDADTAMGYTGAADIMAGVPESGDLLDGDPVFIMGTTGQWDEVTYDSGTNQTSFTDASASFVPGSLAGGYINPNTRNPWPGRVLANTATTLNLPGDWTAGWAAVDDAYQMLNYHLGAGSSCIDTGTDADAPADDLDGNARPVDIPNVGDGLTFDIGAYETQSLDDPLGVAPGVEFASMGRVGGPFTPAQQEYTVSNSGAASLDWTVSKTQAWFDFSLSGGTLAAGGSETVLLSFNTATEALGQGTYTDVLTFINTTSGKSFVRGITLRIWDGVDLVVSNASITPDQTRPGENIMVDWTVMNGGPVTASGVWNDYIYIYQGNTQIAWFGPFERIQDLNVDASYSTSQSITVPQIADGDYQVWVLTDNDNSITEYDDSNNWSSPQNLLVSTGVNLTIGNLGVTPISAIAGEPVTITWTVTNSGIAPALGYWQDIVYASTSDQPFTEPWWEMGHVDRVNDLEAGASYDSSLGFAPDCNWYGNYYFYVVTDANAQIVETNDNDNTSATSVLHMQRSNLQVTMVHVPIIQGMVGQTVQIDWTVTNAGPREATGTWMDGIYLSDDANPGNDIFVNEVANAGNPASGESYNNSYTITIPSVPKSDYWVVVWADWQNGLCEIDENDNGSASTAVSIGEANLEISNPVLPIAEMCSGGEILVGWTVTNLGPDTAKGGWSDTLYLSLNGNVAGATPFGSFQHIEDLPATGNYSMNELVEVPTSMAATTYWVLVHADSGNVLYEPNEDNNLLTAGQLTVLPNDPPVADAGADQTVDVGDTVNLDGSGSSDPNSDPFTFTWTITGAPSGSTAVLNGANTTTPSFVPDLDGQYDIQLIVSDGCLDSAPDSVSITAQALPEGEGGVEGEGAAEGEAGYYTADMDHDWAISMHELLRVIQFYQSDGYHCQAGTEDGYDPGPGDQSCAPHGTDYNPQDWFINVSELLRVIQFYNWHAFHACPAGGTEDGFCVGAGK